MNFMSGFLKLFGRDGISDESLTLKYTEGPADKSETLVRANISILAKREVPDSWLSERKTTVTNLVSGMIFTENVRKHHLWYLGLLQMKFGMYALVDKEWTAVLAGKLKEYYIETSLEVGGGSGWLAKALSEHSVNIICTDIKIQKTVFDVEQIEGGLAVQKYRDKADALIVSWPYAAAYKFLQHWPLGKLVVYVGEGPKGIHADMKFFSKITILESVTVPSFDGYYDTCLICKRVDSSNDFTPDGVPGEHLSSVIPEQWYMARSQEEGRWLEALLNEEDTPQAIKRRRKRHK